jgi:hypothetical protein
MILEPEFEITTLVEVDGFSIMTIVQFESRLTFLHAIHMSILIYLSLHMQRHQLKLAFACGEFGLILTFRTL